MRKNIFFLFLPMLIGLLFATSMVHFSNTEAYLNGLTHYQKHHRDYDRDGEKDSAHMLHVNAIKIIKLNLPAIQVTPGQNVGVQRPPLEFHYQLTFWTAGLQLSIFRPPIFS